MAIPNHNTINPQGQTNSPSSGDDEYDSSWIKKLKAEGKWKEHIKAKCLRVRAFGRAQQEERRERKRKRAERETAGKAFATAIVHVAREKYVARLIREGKEIPLVTHQAMKKQRKVAAAASGEDSGSEGLEAWRRAAEQKRIEDKDEIALAATRSDEGVMESEDEPSPPDNSNDPDYDDAGDDDEVDDDESDASDTDDLPLAPLEFPDENQEAEDESDGSDSVDLLFAPSEDPGEKPEADDAIETRLLGSIIQRGKTGAFLDDFPSRWSSWARFEEHFGIFCAETYPRFPIRSSTKVSHRNAQILKSKKNVSGAVPESWEHYCRTYVCTHGHKYVSRGKGLRQHRLTRFTTCTAKVNCTVTWGGKEHGWYLSVLAKGCHNHDTSEHLWAYYDENRRIQDPALLGKVRQMHETGSHARGILKYLRQRTGKACNLRDVHNLIQSLKNEAKKNTTCSERTEAILREFCDEITVDAKSRAFKEVVLVDTTHGTNRNRYKLFSFVVHDVFGKTKPNLRGTVEVFKKNNPTWTQIQALVSDKAFHEKAVLQTAFPQARQLLCHFHVQEWLFKQVGRLATGTTDEKDILKSSMTALMRALNGDSSHPLFKFFIDNWDSCKAEWVMYLRADVPHLQNNTNNRIEAKWGSIKKVIKPSFEIDEVIPTLITFQQWAEELYLQEIHRAGSRPVMGEDPELSSLAVQVREHAFGLVEKEYKFAASGEADYDVQTPGDGTAHRYSCTCTFNRTLLLPCRHVFYFRRHNDNETVIPPLSLYSQRWALRCPDNDISIGEVNGGGVGVRSVARPSRDYAAMKSSDMYSYSKALMEKINDVMSLQTTPTYKVALSWLRRFYDDLKAGNVSTMEQGGVTANQLAIVVVPRRTTNPATPTPVTP
ncbi:hypothetical protein BBJ28_00009515, partial [Nothophytophthora sp. Chile5]